MGESILLGLLYNTAILLSFSMLYDYSWVRELRQRTILYQLVIGFIAGGIGILLMMTPWIFLPGIVFDTRSVLLSMSGLFLGPLPTIVAMLMTIACRFIMGGDGIWMGMTVILCSGLAGLFWRHFRAGWMVRHPYRELLFLGFVVHLMMLLCVLLLPRHSFLSTFRTLLLPILTLYPAATLLLGSFMLHQLKHWQNRKAREQLLEAEHRFTDMLRRVNLFAVMLDKQGAVTFCNPYFLAETGYSLPELLSKNWLSVMVLPYEQSAVSHFFRALMAGETSVSKIEYSIRPTQGESILVSWNHTVLKDASGAVTGISSLGENITERRKTERELIQAKERAEDSDRLKTAFLQNLSHEIRTPLNAIMGFSSLMPEVYDDRETLNLYAGYIRKGGEDLVEMINDILDISRIESGQLTLQLSDCMLGSLMEETGDYAHLLRERKKKEQIAFRVHFDPALQEILFTTDRQKWRQILHNLLSNAFKFTGQGAVELGCVAGTDGLPVFYVSDTGMGIPADKQSVIFDRFVQLHYEHPQLGSGTGLGLSIVKGLIDLHEGKIWLDSQPDKGSTFYFSFPPKFFQSNPAGS